MMNKRIRWHQMTGQELLAIIVAESAKGVNGSLTLIADARIHLKRINAAGHFHPRAAKPRPPALHGRGNHDTGE